MPVNNPNEPVSKTEQVSDLVSHIPVFGDLASFLISNPFGVFGNIFGGKLVYGIKKSEFELAFSGNGRDNWFWFRALVNLDKGGSNFISEKGSDFLQGLQLNDYIYARFGFRYGAAEPGLSRWYWIEFDPLDLRKPMGLGLWDKKVSSTSPEKIRDHQIIRDNWIDYNKWEYDQDGKFINAIIGVSSIPNNPVTTISNQIQSGLTTMPFLLMGAAVVLMLLFRKA